MSVSKNAINKIGCCACLGDIMGQTNTPFMPVLARITCIIFFKIKVHFAAVN